MEFMMVLKEYFYDGVIIVQIGSYLTYLRFYIKSIFMAGCVNNLSISSFS
jgi:hypothetical protein